MPHWIDALLAAGDDELEIRGLAQQYASLADAWARADDDALRMWLTARFVTDDRDVRAVIATAVACVQACVRDVPLSLPVLDVLPLVRGWTEGVEIAENDRAMGTLRLAQDVVACSASIVEAMRMAERRSKLRAKHPSMSTTQLEIRFANRLAQAVRSAQAAFGTRAEITGGVRARTPVVGETLQSRHRVAADRIVPAASPEP